MRDTRLPIMARLRQMTTRSLVRFLGLSMLTFGYAGTAAAQVIITQVFVDSPVPGQVTIIGRDFDNGPNLEVILGEFAAPLAIVNEAPTQIVAQLPANVVAGDFLLSLTTGGGPNRQDVYNLTIGAPGPADAIPIGAIILWDQNNICPAGFARVAAFDGRFLMAADTVGVLGGANSHTHGSGTLTGPAHSHALQPWDGVTSPVDDNSGGDNFNITTTPAGGGTMSGSTGLENNLPEFATILLCRRA